ncbi:hypothetical protein [Streptomyces sp. NPDC048425]|uniref:hypothetical protein n=1 Tax=Streptomyces sp. NPDC048425 TaxID=3365548 RepID=UPI0037160DB2
MLHISFTPDGTRDIPAGAEGSWQTGRIELATRSATHLRYDYFEYPVDSKVAGQEFLTAAPTPLVDTLFALAHSIETLRPEGVAEIDFTALERNPVLGGLRKLAGV